MPTPETAPCNHDLRRLTDDDSQAVEGTIYEWDGLTVRLTRINGSWYFEDV